MQSDLDICVRNPVTDKRHITFEIAIQTGHPAFTLRSSTTGRKHNEFCWLAKTLKKHHPLFIPPKVPIKKSQRHCDMQWLVQSMAELEGWLYRVVGVDLYLSDTTLHLFLQTDLTCRQIEQYLDGKLTEEIVQRGRRNCECEVAANSGCPMYQQEDDVQTQTVQEPTINHTPIEIRSQQTKVNRGQSQTDSGVAQSISETESDTSSLLDSPFSSLDSSLNSSPSLHVTTGTCLNTNQSGELLKCLSISPLTNHEVNQSRTLADISGTSPPTNHVIDKIEKQTGTQETNLENNHPGHLTVITGTSLPSNHVTHEVAKDYGKRTQKMNFEHRDPYNIDVGKKYNIQESPNCDVKRQLRVEMGVVFSI